MQTIEFKTHLLNQFPTVIPDFDKKIWALQQVKKYYKRRAQVSFEYAKSIERLMQACPVSLWFEESAYEAVFVSMRKVEEEIAKVHSNIAKKIDETVVSKLDSVISNIEASKRRIAVQGNQLVKKLNDEKVSLEKSKVRFYRTNREIELTEFLIEDTKGNNKRKSEHEKAEKRLVKLNQEVIDDKNNYIAQISSVNIIQKDFYSTDMPALMAEIEANLLQRNVILKENYLRFINIMSSSYLDIIEPYERFRYHSDELVPASDLVEYVSGLATEPTPFPESVVFEPYTKQGRGEQKKGFDGFLSRMFGPSGQPTENEKKLFSKSKFPAFGTPLQTLLDIQKSIFPNMKVPFVFKFLAESIIQMQGETSLGIFRLSGAGSSVELLKDSLDEGNYNFPEDTSVNTLASLLKLFLRSLPVPIFPPNLYEKCIADDSDMNEIVDMLPKANKSLLIFLIDYLKHFCSDCVVEKTRMPDTNLSAIFAPCVFRCPYEEMKAMLEAGERERAFVLKMIHNLDTSEAECLNIPYMSSQFVENVDSNLRSRRTNVLEKPEIDSLVSSTPQTNENNETISAIQSPPLPTEPPNENVVKTDTRAFTHIEKDISTAVRPTHSRTHTNARGWSAAKPKSEERSGIVSNKSVHSTTKPQNV